VIVLKAFISVDMEGMPYVVIPGQLNLKGSLYDEARKIATRVTLTVADELNKNGFQTVIIADSHGPMVNLLVDDLPEYVEIVRGFYRPLAMVAGAEGCDAALFLGYHAKFGTAKSTFDHTYSGTHINRLEINGVPASEFLLNGYALGELNVPVIMVAGEAKLLEEDIKKQWPNITTVALKSSLSRVSAQSPSMLKIEKELRNSVKRATTNFKKGKVKPQIVKKPVRMKITFMGSQFADVAELLPTAKRLDGLNVEYTASTLTKAYRTFELLVLAAAGMSASMESTR
jgi:D-amino peptidase